MTLESGKGEQRTLWGVDLERAMTEAAPEVGDRIALQHTGSEPVRLPDGQMVERHSWKVRDAGELAYDQLERRLSRSGVKETTLDYARNFAERRGIAETLGVRSEIEIPAKRGPDQVQQRDNLTVDVVPASLGVRRRGRDRDHAHDHVSSTKVTQDAGEHNREAARREVPQMRGSLPKAGEDLAQDLRSDRAGGQQRQGEPARQRRFEGLKLSRGTAAERKRQDRVRTAVEN